MNYDDTNLPDSVRKENIRMHDRDSSIYDFRHPYMRDKKLQKRIIDEINQIDEALNRKNNIKVLDCGVGTGNLTIRCLEKGWQVTAVDISGGMLKVLSEKIKVDLSSRLSLVEADIDVYLADKINEFDVISFGATLHHLPDYLKTIKLSCRALKHGGVLYVTGEPAAVVNIRRAEIVLMRIDEYCNVFYKIIFRPRLIANIFARIFKFGSDEDNINESLAEFHADTGIDQNACLLQIEEEKLNIDRFEYYGMLGYKITRILASLLRIDQRSHFMLIARKNSAKGSH